MKRITGRTWAFVIYPDSLPDNYEEIILNTGLPMAISPLHDKDINPDGTPKKTHFHVIIYYENATTFNNVKQNVTDLLKGTIPIKLESMRGMYRYHLHLDNPEKYQYDDRDRKFYNGFDIDMASKLTKTEINKIIRLINDLIRTTNIYEYSDLIDNLDKSDNIQLLEIAQQYVSYFVSYLNSRRYKKEQTTKRQEENKSLLDKLT